MINSPHMRLAKRLSLKSTHRVRIGAVVVNKKSIVSVGWNNNKTHPIITGRKDYKHVHAEISTIVGIDRRQLEGGTLYVYRELRTGEIGMCKPCVDCVAILREVGIRHIYYTDPSQPEKVGYLQLGGRASPSRENGKIHKGFRV